MVALVVAFVLFAFGSAFGSSWKITSGILEVDHRSSTVSASGGVVVEGPELTLYANFVSYDTVAKRFLARGNVRVFFKSGDLLVCSELFWDLRTGAARIKNAYLFLKKDALHIKAREVLREGPNTFLAKSATVSACDLSCGSRPVWSVFVYRLKVSRGVARARVLSPRVLGIPVFVTPYAEFPVKRYRKSGLLFPRAISGTATGFGVEQPLFLTLGDSADITLYGLWTERLGLAPAVELRYALSQKSKGLLRFRTLEEEEEVRYWLLVEVNQFLGNHTLLGLELDLVSDERFLEEFDLTETGITDSRRTLGKTFGRVPEERNLARRPSKLWFVHYFGNSLLWASSSYAKALDSGRQPTTLYPLAEFGLALAERPFSKYTGFSLKLSGSYWYREEGSKALRNEVSPVLSLRIPSGPLETSATLKASYVRLRTFVGTSVVETEREVVEAKARTSLVVERRFRRTKHSQGLYLELLRRDVFKRGSAEFLYEDGLSEEFWLEFGVFQLLLKRTASGLKRPLKLEVFQRYLPEEERFSEVFLRAEASLPNLLSVTYRTAFDPEKDAFTFHGLSLNLGPPSKRISLWYEKDEELEAEQLTTALNLTTRSFNLSGSISRNLNSGQFSYGEVRLGLKFTCIGVRVGVGMSPEETRFFLGLDLKGRPSTGPKCLLP